MHRQATLIVSLFFTLASLAQVWQYVDPRIGSEGVGRTFPGPSMPFGMDTDARSGDGLLTDPCQRYGRRSEIR